MKLPYLPHAGQNRDRCDGDKCPTHADRIASQHGGADPAWKDDKEITAIVIRGNLVISHDIFLMCRYTLTFTYQYLYNLMK